MKLTTVLFAVITATLSAKAFEMEHHDHTALPQLSRRSVQDHHHIPQDQDLSSRDEILLEFSTRELVDELEARIMDPHYNHMERREPGFRTWLHKTVNKLTGTGGQPPVSVGAGYGGAPIGGGMTDANIGAVDPNALTGP